MGVVGLSWCLSALSGVIAVTTSAITWVPPGPGPIARSLPVIFGASALIGAGMAIGLGRLPPTSRIRQSRSLWFTLAAIVLAETVMAVLVG